MILIKKKYCMVMAAHQELNSIQKLRHIKSSTVKFLLFTQFRCCIHMDYYFIFLNYSPLDAFLS